MCDAGMLVRNYRSHSSLLQIPNRLFYGDTLLAAAEQTALLPPRWDPFAATAGERGAPAAGADEQPNGVAEVKPQCAAPLIYPLYLCLLAKLNDFGRTPEP